MSSSVHLGRIPEGVHEKNLHPNPYSFYLLITTLLVLPPLLKPLIKASYIRLIWQKVKGGYGTQNGILGKDTSNCSRMSADVEFRVTAKWPYMITTNCTAQWPYMIHQIVPNHALNSNKP